MKIFAKFAAVSAIALFAAGAHAEDPTADTVIATVNGTDITLAHLIIAKAQLPQQYQQLPADVLWDGLMEQLIQQQLLADELSDVPTRAQRAIENEERSIKAGERIAALTDEFVTEDALKAAYDAQVATIEPVTEFHAAHILVASEDEAKAVKARLEAGEDFATVAKEVSTDPGAANGGDLGWFGPGMMVEPFETAVAAMEPGSLSDPVQTQFGWHIVNLIETREKPVPTLDELRDQLGGQLQEQAITSHLEELTSGAEITRIEAGTVDPAVLNDLTILDK